MKETGKGSASEGSVNQRRHLRSPLLIQKVLLDDGRKAFFGYAKNISRSGLFISTVNPREPGDRIHLEIPLPPPLPSPVQVNCEVVWNRQFSSTSPYEPGMGLRFLDLPEETARIIDDWIRDHSR